MTAIPADLDATSHSQPLITIAVPSLNQGQYIARTLQSIFEQEPAVLVNVLDAGSTDQTLEQVAPFQTRLNHFRSHRDAGQAAAINEGLLNATTPYVSWLNADDEYADGGLAALVDALERHPDAPFAYGRTRLEDGEGNALGEYAVEEWNRDRFARRCYVSQPATLMRATAWQQISGLDGTLHMALDYDLWWRLSDATSGPPVFVDRIVALARLHPDAKTMSRPSDHYREAMAVVRRHYGKVPLWWWLKMPASIGARRFLGRAVGLR